MATHILILDTPSHDMTALSAIMQELTGGRAKVSVADREEAFSQAAETGEYDLLLLNLQLGDGDTDGEHIVRSLRQHGVRTPIIAVAEEGSVELADRAIAAGATDFLVNRGDLSTRIRTLLGKTRNLLHLLEENRQLGEQNMLLREESRACRRIVGESPQILSVISQVERVAKIPRPVLITGERGTGKELVARAIHDAAGQGSRPFVAVNCAAFSDTLLESELFGHEKGAFTGADNLVRGRFEQASGGTLFLDEIGNMSLPFQQKILRVVEYGVFTRVGGRDEVHTDARIIAATNSRLERKMESGQFLRDLYDRLAFEVIDVPPLREREGDVQLLARHFLREFMVEIPALDGKRLASSAVEALLKYPFPGNIRELKNIIERAAYRDVTNEITPEDIGLLPDTDVVGETPGRTFEEKVENFRKRLILSALERAGNNQAQAARDLGLSYHQYRYYLKKYQG